LIAHRKAGTEQIWNNRPQAGSYNTGLQLALVSFHSPPSSNMQLGVFVPRQYQLAAFDHGVNPFPGQGVFRCFGFHDGQESRLPC
jgi:hypothetical protein